MKKLKIKMLGKPGSLNQSQEFFWTVRYVLQATLLGCYDSEGKKLKPRKISGWMYKDNEGYERFSEGNWITLVENLKFTAQNYDMIPLIS